MGYYGNIVGGGGGSSVKTCTFALTIGASSSYTFSDVPVEIICQTYDGDEIVNNCISVTDNGIPFVHEVEDVVVGSYIIIIPYDAKFSGKNMHKDGTNMTDVLGDSIFADVHSGTTYHPTIGIWYVEESAADDGECKISLTVSGSGAAYD